MNRISKLRAGRERKIRLGRAGMQKFGYDNASRLQTVTDGWDVFLPKTPETFVYDADGNLLSEGRWTNSWDAENQLISMQGLSTLPAAARLKLDFEYDWQGRRIRKTVSNCNDSQFVAASTNRFIYDG